MKTKTANQPNYSPEPIQETQAIQTPQPAPNPFLPPTPPHDNSTATPQHIPAHRRCSPEHDAENDGFRVVHDEDEIIRLISERHNGKELHARQRPRKLIQGVTFDCEEWMLEIKLNELGNIIDHFIIVEGAYTLQNTPRTQCFHSIMRSNDRISQWAHKIAYVYDDHPIPGFVYWEAEVYYRNLIGLAGLERIVNLTRDDLIIVTDMDELPHPAFLSVLKTHDGFRTPINLHMLWSYYSYKWTNTASWPVNAIVSVAELARAGNRTNQVRFDLLSSPDGWSTGPAMIVGWHCSWCMPTARFIDKMAHFAHSELNQDRFRDESWLNNMREQGLWFPDAAPNGCVQSKLQVPEYVRNNAQKFHDIST